MPKTKLAPKPWPKLSETLSFDSRLQCQNCHCFGSLTHWIECDEDDRLQAVFVILCQVCADRIVGKHPRLYVEMLPGECMPGAMQVCDDCVFRERLRCTCPQAMFNGGPGIKFDPPPQRVHFCSRSKGVGGWHAFMPDEKEVKLAGGQQCSGKIEVIDANA